MALYSCLPRVRLDSPGFGAGEAGPREAFDELADAPTTDLLEINEKIELVFVDTVGVILLLLERPVSSRG